MKKVISSILICLTAVSAFASCGKDDGSSDKKKDKGIIGKWEMTEETKKKQYDEGMKIETASMEFEKDSVTLSAKMDSSEYMALYDDKITVSGMDLEILDFDNKVLSAGKNGQEVLKFERKEESEDMYGDYEIPEKMNASGEEGFLTFEKEGVSYMTVVATHSYTYDEESGEIRLDEDEAGDKDTVKVDGDTLTFTDSFGNEQVFERAD
jgi:hypothetical protein